MLDRAPLAHGAQGEHGDDAHADGEQDRAEHAGMGLDVSVPAGDFSDCVLVLDDNAIENPKSKKKNLEEKIYCPAIGFVTDEELVLVDLFVP